MPAIPSFIIDPIWCQFAAMIRPVTDTHPLGCRRPRIADTTCSATTLRTPRDEWIATGIFEKLEQTCLEAFDRIAGLLCGGNLPGEMARMSPINARNGSCGPPAVRVIPMSCLSAGAQRRQAAAICRHCQIRTQCLATTLDDREEFGVWGGLTERQRRALLRHNPQVANWADYFTAGGWLTDLQAS